MNLLPLETFRAILGYHPWHFWQLSNDTSLRVTSACNTLVYEYAWQATDATGRADIRRAIQVAETRLREYLGYSVAPRYTSATLPWPRYLDQSTVRSGTYNPRGQWQSVTLPEGHVQAVGTERLTLIDTPAVVYSDEDSDGLSETFTVTATTTVTDPALIAVYFAAADRMGQDAGDTWRVQPVQVRISGGVATITGRAVTLVRPVLYEGVAQDGINADVSTNFAQTLDVCQRSTDGQQQATLIWEHEPWPSWCAHPTGSTDPASVATATARVGIRNADAGIVYPVEVVYNNTTETWSAASCVAWCREPDRVTINYLAGVPLEQQAIAERWREIVAYLAMAELARPVCGCDQANRSLYYWQFDLARTSGSNGEAYGAISASDLDNPFGTRRGQVAAWKRVQQLRHLRGVLI